MHTPTEVRLQKQSKNLVVSFDDGQTFTLSCEYLRVFSPSAEVRGHASGQEVLQAGKEGVNIDRIEPMGHYALKLVFDDGHDSGIYSWDYLYKLGLQFDQNWEDYLAALQDSGYERKS